MKDEDKKLLSIGIGVAIFIVGWMAYWIASEVWI